MADTWRLIDTGLRPAAQNIALNRALLEARRAEEIPSTLRFLRFPACALLGNRQSAAQLLDLEWCRQSGMEVQRRITAGDAFFLDSEQIGWELYLHRRDLGGAGLRAAARRLCHAAATGVSALGVNAAYRAPQDIEVDGRRVCETAALFDGEALLFQGVLLLDFSAPTLLRGSRFWSAVGPLLADRVASLRHLLGAKPDLALVKRYLTEAFESDFGVQFADGELTLSEHARYEGALREIRHPDWIELVARPADALPVLEGVHAVPGAQLRAAVAFERETRTLRRVWFAADVTIAPPRVLADLEAALLDAPASRVAQRVEQFFAERAVQMAPLQPMDFVRAVERALGHLVAARLGET